MKTHLTKTSKFVRCALAASALMLASNSWAALSVSANQIGSAHFEITGVCNVNGGKVTLELKPIALTPASYNGPKKYQLTYLQGQGGAATQVAAPSTTTTGHCKVAGMGKMYLMKKSDWAPGLWELKVHQGGGQSAVIQVNM